MSEPSPGDHDRGHDRGRAAAATMREDFPEGCRVRWKRTSITGAVVGYSRFKVNVVWDGVRLPSQLYATSLEPYGDGPVQTEPPPLGALVDITNRNGRVIAQERVTEHGASTWRTTGGYTLPRTQPWRLVRDEERDG